MPSFAHSVAAFTYAFPVNKLIQAAKFSEQLALIDRLADALSHAINTRPDAIVAMPLHPLRLRERGFNQSALLAQHIAKQLYIPLQSCPEMRV